MNRLLKNAFLTAIIVSVFLTAAAGLLLARENTPKNFAKLTFVHYGKAGGARGNVPTDQVTDYKYTGIRWDSTTPEIRYTIDPANSGLDAARLQSAVDSATSTWHGADTKVTLIDDGIAAAAADPGAAPDNQNTVSFRSITSKYPNAIAVTYAWYNVTTKRVFEVDMIMNVSSTVFWSVNPDGAKDFPGYDVQNIATHEAGHFLVLGDLYKPRDAELTMYGYGDTGETKKDTLGVGDTLGINRIYP